MEEIEERLRARAGNPGYNKVYNKFEGEEKINSAKPNVYGNGISENEIKKIIEEFKNG